MAHKHRLPLIVDNTVTPPPLFNPFEHGAAYVLKIRTGLLATLALRCRRSTPGSLSKVETLPLRARARSGNAQAVAEHLKAHPAVSWVDYAGLPDHPDHQRAKRFLPLGPGAVFSFGVKGGLEAGKKFINSVKLASHLANVLEAKTLVIHPASTTHSQLSPEELLSAGVTPDLVRVSVGIEDIKDIIADLDQALQASQQGA